MSFTDPIGDMITRIRNGQLAMKETIVSPFSTMRENLLTVLKNEGFIENFERVNVREGIDELKIELRYFEGKGAIHKIQRISKPGCRVYSKAGEIETVHNGLGVSILSTSKGVMSDSEARREGLGGEVLCHVF